jgi:hypothetical protein
MPNFEFEFVYFTDPIITVAVTSAMTGVTKLIRAHLDTGAQATILDASVARDLQLDLTSAPSIELTGLGGRMDGRIENVQLRLLNQSDLALNINVAFVEGITQRVGNLLGLDLLAHFDFGLSHAQRLGYLGRSLT